MTESICTCYTCIDLQGNDVPTLCRTCPIHLVEATEYYEKFDRECAAASLVTKNFRGLAELRISKGYAVSGDSIQTLDDRDAYKRGFEAALKWLDSLVREDALSDAPKDGTFSDEYKMDLDDIRAARRRLEKRA